MRLSSLSRGLAPLVAALLTAGAAGAQEIEAQAIGDLEVIGAPSPGGIGFQPAATGQAAQIHWLDGMLLLIIAAITVLVLAVLGYIMWRYNRARNPEPGSFTHNSPLEVTWTVLPIGILAFIAVFSLPVLFNQQVVPEEPDVTIDITGYQWYWHYAYPEHDIAFDSFMLERDELEDYGYSQDLYKLATNTAVVVPVDSTIVANVTGGDVIHSWTVPAFGVKQDAVPGRSAQLWFEADQTGIYFGQCSELCGQNHAFMPVTVKVVTQDAYQRWLDAASEEYAAAPRAREVASAQ